MLCNYSISLSQGNPTEVFYFGGQIMMTILGCIPACLLVHQGMIPVFYNLGILSLNEVSKSSKAFPKGKLCSNTNKLDMISNLGRKILKILPEQILVFDRRDKGFIFLLDLG